MAEGSDRDNIPQAMVAPTRRRRLSAVWIVPLFAAAVAIGIAIQRITSEGPTITIVFKSAEGIEAGKTFVKYKDVNIGQVTAVKLAADYTKVEVTAKIDKSAADLMVEDARFWIVEPRVTLGGISGLGTLLSGNYIGLELGKSNKRRRNFTGLDVPPIVTQDQPGRQFLLSAQDLGSLGIGSPIYYRRLLAGQVVGYDLTDDGTGVNVKIFVNAPYERFVNAGTRFWNASGIDISMGAGGVDVRTQSLVALLAGGVAFDTPDFASKPEPAAADAKFTLYGDRATALKQPEAVAAHYVLYFTESLRGLSVGAPVTLLGLPAGEVTKVGLDLDPATMKIRGRVEIVSYPERIITRLHATQQAAGKNIAHSEQQRRAFFQNMVEQRGLRAQLRSGSLITGQLFVAFDYFPDAPKPKVDWKAELVELPVVPSELVDIEQKVTAILAKLDNLPYDAIGAELKKVLTTLDQTLKDVNKAVNRIDTDVTPGLKTAVEEIRGAIQSADTMVKNTDATLVGRDAPAQQELRDALQEITRAARAVRVLADYLERNPEALIRGKAGQ